MLGLHKLHTIYLTFINRTALYLYGKKTPESSMQIY